MSFAIVIPTIGRESVHRLLAELDGYDRVRLRRR